MNKVMAVLAGILALGIGSGGVLAILAAPVAGMGGGDGQSIMTGGGIGALVGAGILLWIAVGLWQDRQWAWLAFAAIGGVTLVLGVISFFGGIPLGLVLSLVGAGMLAAASIRLRSRDEASVAG